MEETGGSPRRKPPGGKRRVLRKEADDAGTRKPKRPCAPPPGPLTCECTALCCSRLTACPNVLPQISHAKGLVPLCDLRTCTSSPCGVENT